MYWKLIGNTTFLCNILSCRDVRNIEIDKGQWVPPLTISDHYSPLVDLLIFPHLPFIFQKKKFVHFFRKKSSHTLGGGGRIYEMNNSKIDTL